MRCQHKTATSMYFTIHKKLSEVEGERNQQMVKVIGELDEILLSLKKNAGKMLRTIITGDLTNFTSVFFEGTCYKHDLSEFLKENKTLLG